MMVNEPRWYRESKGHVISWEIYSWNNFFITLSLGSFEIQINKWSNS